MNLTRPPVPAWQKQSGRTTQQIRTAARGAIYVCHDWPQVSYVKALARSLSREDLEVVAVSQDLRGRTDVIILDHACDEQHGNTYYQQHLNRAKQAQAEVSKRHYAEQVAAAQAALAILNEDTVGMDDMA